MASPDRATGSAGQQRWEFVQAFTEHSWARPGADRPVARPLVVLVVTTLAAGLALAAGVVIQLIWPVKLAPAKPPAPAGSSARYSAVSGWDCATTADHGFEASGRQPTWLTIARGGWAQDGCHGTFEAIPVTGGAAAGGDRDPSVVWWFSPSAESRRCTVSTYLPVLDRAGYEPVSAVRFLVLAGRDRTVFAEFTVDQAAQPGRWVTAGTYPVPQGGIAVQLVASGGAANPNSRLAVAQIKLDCTG